MRRLLSYAGVLRVSPNMCVQQRACRVFARVVTTPRCGRCGWFKSSFARRRRRREPQPTVVGHSLVGVAAARLPRAGHPPPDGTGGHLPSARGPLCGALQGGRGGPRAGIARVRRVEEHSGGRKGARGG
eukprot:1019755-Pyramimonas_sp.AAC.1